LLGDISSENRLSLKIYLFLFVNIVSICLRCSFELLQFVNVVAIMLHVSNVVAFSFCNVCEYHMFLILYDGHATNDVQLTVVLLSGHFPNQEVALLRSMLTFWTHYYN